MEEEQKNKKKLLDIDELRARNSQLKRIKISDGSNSRKSPGYAQVVIGSAVGAIGLSEFIVPGGLHHLVSASLCLFIGILFLIWDLFRNPKNYRAAERTQRITIVIVSFVVFFSGIEVGRFQMQRQNRLELLQNGDSRFFTIYDRQILGRDNLVSVRNEYQISQAKTFRVNARDFNERTSIGQKVRVAFRKNSPDDFLLADIDLDTGFPIALSLAIFFSGLIFLLWLFIFKPVLLRVLPESMGSID